MVKKSFTLIELLMVITLTAVIGAAIAGSFFSGVKLWQRFSSSREPDTQALIAFLQLAGDLRSYAPSRHITCNGAADAFSFPAAQDAGVARLDYYFDQTAKTLFKKKLTLARLIDNQTAEDVDPIRVSEFDRVDFQYLRRTHNGSEWVDTWGLGEFDPGVKYTGCPAAVRINFKRRGAEYNKTVFLPAADNKEIDRN